MEGVKTTALVKVPRRQVVSLWLRCFPDEKEFSHGAWCPSLKPLSASSIEERFFGRKAFDPAGAFAAVSDGKLIGFASGTVMRQEGKTIGYWNIIAVDPAFRKKGIGSKLLQRVEGYFARKGASEIRTAFEGHPMAVRPGVPVDDEAYPFFLNRHYRSYSPNLLQVMVQDTSKYRFTAEMKALLATLEKQGIAVCKMQQKHAHSLENLLEAEFASWKDGIMRAVAAGKPIIAAVHRERVLGFSGPYHVDQRSGRGGFYAVGVAAAERGKGLGKAVFNVMCRELRRLGAKTTALTTNVDNPAQEIYSKAGYKARYVVDFGMKKTL